jgi:hypothetical protein
MGLGGIINAAGRGIRDTWNTLTTGHNDPGGRRRELEKPYDVNAAAFNPAARADVQGLQTNAESLGDKGEMQRAGAEGRLQGGFSAPQMGVQQTVRSTGVNAVQDGASMGLDAANTALGSALGSRAGQQDALGLVGQTARGQGPSVAGGMIAENAARAGANIQRAGVDANSAFGNAADAARLGYGDAAGAAAFGYQQALAQQQGAGAAAATQAARQQRDAAEQAVLSNAALVAGTRGRNIGASTLAAQGQAAAQTAGANRQAGQIMADQQAAAQLQAAQAQQTAAFNAANQQRSAATIQAADNRQAGATLANASIGAREAQGFADAQAAQVASQEQLAAQGMLLEGTSAARAGDSAMVGDALGMGQLGLGQDTLRTNTAVGNADRLQNADQFNATLGYNYDSQQAQLDAANNALNAGVWAGQAGRGQDLQTGMLSNQIGMTEQDIAAQMELERLRSANANAGMARGQQFDENATSNRLGVGGALLDVGGKALGAFALSDEREKDIDGDEDDHDFRATKSKRYRYKDPKVPGADDREHVGPMAQELPKSVVVEGEDGKLRVDVARLALSLSSAVGELQRELKANDRKVLRAARKAA